MRSRSFTLVLIPLLVIPVLLADAGCKRRNRDKTTVLASNIYAGDPNAATHFAKGFYEVEQNAWRWTGKEFAVDLAPPLHADQKGAQLVMKLSVPDSEIQKVASVQLSASIDGYKLEPQLYTKGGQFTYSRDIPADKLQSDAVRIDFAVDHTLPPTDTDQRELGIIVSEVGLVAK